MFRKLTVLFLVVFTILSCSDSSKPVVAESIFKNCLSDEALSLVSTLKAEFDSYLLEQFPDTEVESEKYELYLSAVENITLPPETLINERQRNLCLEIYLSPEFSNIWTNLKNLEYPESDSGELKETVVNKTDYDLFTMNPEGSYIECLEKHCDITSIGEYLKVQRDFPGISSVMIARLLGNQLEQEMYEKEIVQTIIAVHVYFELVFNLNYDESFEPKPL